mmetsp:Transcript_49/g.149  ORF Transcript_49/g.149 Transcript_49/m.149 type:complete len:245 (-) Transcript_49:548-1282(-)
MRARRCETWRPAIFVASGNAPRFPRAETTPGGCSNGAPPTNPAPAPRPPLRCVCSKKPIIFSVAGRRNLTAFFSKSDSSSEVSCSSYPYLPTPLNAWSTSNANFSSLNETSRSLSANVFVHTTFAKRGSCVTGNTASGPFGKNRCHATSDARSSVTVPTSAFWKYGHPELLIPAKSRTTELAPSAPTTTEAFMADVVAVDKSSQVSRCTSANAPDCCLSFDSAFTALGFAARTPSLSAASAKAA